MPRPIDNDPCNVVGACNGVVMCACPVHIKNIEDLRKCRGCGMNGSSYTHYGLQEGDLDQGSQSYRVLIQKLKLSRCDYFVEELEVVAQLNGGRDKYLEDPAMRHNDVAGAVKPALHLVTSKFGASVGLRVRSMRRLHGCGRMANFRNSGGRTPGICHFESFPFGISVMALLRCAGLHWRSYEALYGMTLKPEKTLQRLGAAALLLSLGPIALASDCIKTVRWYDDAPYSFKAVSGEIQGFNVDVTREVLRRMGCGVRFVELPWARALVELEVGRLDILPGALRKPERERYAYFSRTFGRSSNVLFVRKSALNQYRLARLSDLAGTSFQLGVQIGVMYGPEFESLSKKSAVAIRITQLSQRKSAWKMMALGRLDGFIADEVTALTELQQLGLSGQIVRSAVIVSQEPAKIAFSKQSVTVDFVKDFDQQLDDMTKDGSYRELRERFILCATSMETLGCK